ncbi:MAG: hypothetical protein HRU38_11265 [Saccharospirillaceae bacterium]|nr:hypothetical protein [Pseudomonadales bacterium]NRB79232.1 hypothetical protein [Saccharospirillaceae bacterium]
MSDVWEIVQLESGDIALQDSQNDKEPLMVVKFSNKDLKIKQHQVEIAKAMFNSAIETITNIQEQEILEQIHNTRSDFVH